MGCDDASMGKQKKKKKRTAPSGERSEPHVNGDIPPEFLVTFLVKPAARENRIYFEGDRAFLDIAAPPVKGKANRAIIHYLSRELNIPKSHIVLLRGQKSHEKTFRIFGTNFTIDFLREKYRV